MPALGVLVAMNVAALALGAADAHAASASADREEVHCLALTLYWEARNEGRRGMVPVGWVVLNRRQHPTFPSSVCRVVREGGERPPCQFSFWCDGRSDAPPDDESWTLARSVAEEMLSRPPTDPTRGALYFHSVSVAPAWAKERRRTVRIGQHVYYR
jgi:spore germination cell wall hydrolase CwlJ-like protein